MQKRWQINSKAPNDFIKQFPEYPALVLQLLFNRNIRDQSAIDEFFNPDYEEGLYDPFLMKGMKRAVERIFKAVRNKEKIIVFGDYDADGLTSAAVLVKILEALGARPDVYIPDRAKEGYGLNLEAIRRFKELGVKLIITVDCGVSDFEEVELACQLGIEVIITDHHWVGEKLPRAFAILNPKQDDCQYPFKELAGVGVAYKLAQGLVYKLKACPEQSRRIKNEKLKINEGFEKWLLDLVAIGTVADCVPLVGENRILVKYGLIVLGKTQRIGLKTLMKNAGIINNNHLPLTTYEINFVIAPRLNAAGRMDHANHAYKLLISESLEEAKQLSEKLEEKNYQRQKITEKIVREVKSRLSGKEKIIFEGNENWPVGVVGLVASKLVDEANCPALIFSKGKKQSIGSGRSIHSFNLIEAISRCSKHLCEFGGHRGAAGFTLDNSKLVDFKDQLEAIAGEEIQSENLVPVINIDAEINSEDINWNIYDQIAKFSPFGEGNPKPLFLVRNLKISQMRIVGNGGKHLKLKLTAQRGGNGNIAVSSQDSLQKTFDAIGFSFGGCIKKINQGDLVDVVFELIADEWNGMRQLQLKIIDLKKSKK